jgi:hypothetical protein
MKELTPRLVKIDTLENRKVHFVRFVHRQKYQKHLAAQFSTEDNTLEDVKNWVRKQPNLKLEGTP